MLDCLFGWCASTAMPASCGVKKNVEPDSFFEAAGLRFQKGDVSEEEDGDKEQHRVEIVSHA